MQEANKKSQNSPKKGQKKRGPKIRPRDNNGAILLRFTVDGHNYAFNPIYRGRFDNDLDLAKARQIAQQIEIDLTIGQFDSTLEKYKPIKVVPSQATNAELVSPNILDLYHDYLMANNPERESYNGNIRHARSLLSKLDKELLTLDRAYDAFLELSKNYANSTLKHCFKECRTAVNWHNKRGKNLDNPYTAIVTDIEKRIASANSNSKKTKVAASTDDIAAIVQAFKDNAYSSPKAPSDNHSYYANFVAFLFATGCRPEDARAVQWEDIIEKNGKTYIKFHKASPKPGVIKATKNNTIRLFPVNCQLQAILDAAKVQNQQYNLATNPLIFPSKKGQVIDGQNFQMRHFKPVVEGLVADGSIDKYLTQGNGRHSFITTMRGKGIPDAVIAALVETSPEMIASHYSDDGVLINVDLPIV